MASIGGRLCRVVKGELRLIRPRQFTRLPSCIYILQSNYCTASDTEPRLLPEEVDEDEINRIRDVSRLSPTIKARIRGEFPPNFGEREYHSRKAYRRRLFAKFGSSSGLDPASMFPSKAEMQEMIDDQAKYEMSVAEMMVEVEEKKRLQAENDRLREKRVAEIMVNMPKMIADFHNQATQKEILKKKQEEKKAKLLEEAREYFGYSVDPRDDKFKVMLAEKEAAEKKEAKQRKKAERQAKVTARIESLAKP